MTILPLTYLGGMEWFTYLLGGGCVIDIGENWVKQTVRNRCEIMTSGGVAALTVPVHGGGGGVGTGAKIATKEIRIDNSKRWQHMHWQSLVSAYRNSPYFDHYEERFAPVYTVRRLNFLIDLNLELLNILTPILGMGIGVEISENYVVAAPDDFDLRGKKAFRRLNGSTFGTAVQSLNVEENSGLSPNSYKAGCIIGRGTACATPKYTQVFSDRAEFVSGLSVVDLIFCEGPAARDFLRVPQNGRLPVGIKYPNRL